MRDVLLLTVHGMGDTDETYAEPLRKGLRRRLSSSEFRRVHIRSVYYQEILQDQQERMWEDMKDQGTLDMSELRKFLLFGFSDAAALERNASVEGSPYDGAQERIRAELATAFDELATDGEGPPVIVVAQSLGGQVISNYLWDAQLKAGATRGVWQGRPHPEADARREWFERLANMRYLYTTGCNIPVFLAGFPENRIRPVAPKQAPWSFEWKNYYDRDDVLGWPLKPMNAAYAEAVDTDLEINAGWGPMSMTPFSHSQYWQDTDVLRPLGHDLLRLMGR